MKKKYFVLLTLLGIIFFIIFSQKELYFYLKGDNIVEININETYKDEGIVAKYCDKYLKLFCRNLTNEVKTSEFIDKNNNNTFYINYSINQYNNSKVLTRTIIKVDKESPVIELNKYNKYVCPNKEYKEDGYKAYDNVDGDITDKVIKEIKNNKIYYTVSDTNGNKKIVYRDIEFEDNEKPNIKLNGNDTIYLFLNNEYIEKGYTVVDNCDGDITNYVNIKSNLNTSKIGNYEIEYSVTDHSGNKTSTKRNVVVYSDTSKIQKNGKIVYLTFDDGPNNYTKDILKVLDKYNVKATFFVTNQFSEFQYLIKTEYMSGHSIGVHTLTHNFGTIYSSLEEYMKDFNDMNQIIYEQTGEYTKLFRFPGGSSNTISKFNKGIMTELAHKLTKDGYYYFDWNVDSNDTETKDSEQIFKNVINEIEKKDISVVLMHDIKKYNIESVDKIISYGLKNGYTFLPIDETTPLVQHSIKN